MKTYEEKVSSLRLDMIAYIEEFLIEANRSIIVPRGHLSYMDWDSATFENSPLGRQVVPEIEIVMIYLSPEKQVRFLDENNNEVWPSSLDTEEILSVTEYLDEIELAPVDEQ